jgi:Rha family phage regulatory protein
MNDLTIIEQNGQKVVDSREVAEMVDRPHNDLMKTIRQYCEYLDQGDVSQISFFIESEYLDAYGRKQPCFLLTKMGCDMVANKLTGEKGVLFTAAYVTKFHEMDQKKEIAVLPPMTPAQLIAAIAQNNAEQERMIAELKEKAAMIESRTEAVENTISDIREVFGPRQEDFKTYINKMIAKIVKATNGSYEIIRRETYDALENNGFDLKIRLQNAKGRALLAGASKSQVDSMNKLQVIESEKTLKELYIAIVQRMAIRHGVVEGSPEQ